MIRTARFSPPPCGSHGSSPRRERPYSKPGVPLTTVSDGSARAAIRFRRLQSRCAFEVCMRSPEGVDHWTKGTLTEVVAPERLTIDHHVIDPCGGGPLFTALTQVKFSAAAGGTLMEVVQTYTLSEPAQAEPMLKGAPEGWRQTLDKLEAEVARIQGSSGGRSVVHGAFHLERTYDATEAQVYKALSDEAAKGRWFFGPQGWRLIERAMDFRVGGRERVKGGFEGGVATAADAIYHDIVPRERIVYSYEMHLDERKISVSLATLEIEPAGAGRTKLKVCEQGAFLDGYDDAGKREHGTGDLLDKLPAPPTPPCGGRRAAPPTL